MTKQIIIELENVGCCYKLPAGLLKYKKYQALKSVSLIIKKGETLGIIGSNGAGKTTLLNIISGIILPTNGKLFKLPGLSISLLKPQAGFNRELSGRTNAVLSGMLLGFTQKQMLRKIDQIIAFAELEKSIDNPLKTYSSGMRARLGFAVGLELNPDVLLVDEALGAGDASFSKKAVTAMKTKIMSDQTVVLVSHQMETVCELCSKVVWIEDGKTRMTGDADTVTKAYLEYSKKEKKRPKRLNSPPGSSLQNPV